MLREPLAGVRVAGLVLCLIAVAVPFLSVHFAPLSDLPQQVAQIRLAHEAGGHPESPLRVQWLATNRLSYALLYAAWAVFDPLDVGRMAMLFIGLLWVVSLHLFAAARGRPLEAAVLASLLFFNHFVYWGFYNFAIGVPVFLLWIFLLALPSPPRNRALYAAALGATGLLLFFAHALLLAAGVAWFALRHLLFRIPVAQVAFRAAALVPALAMAVPTYLHTEKSVAAAGFSTAAVWGPPLLSRLSPLWLVDQAFGALPGRLEPLLCTFFAVWALVGLWQQKKNLRGSVDLEILTAGAMCVVFTLALPIKYTNTIYFAQRWFPVAVALLLLSLPAPRLRWRMHLAIPVAIFIAFSAFTTARWREIELTDFSGLAASLAALPGEPRILGLDYLKTSPRLKIDRPFLQTFSYSQVVKGGELNFSFADHPTSLATFNPPRRPPWTPGMEWYAEWVRFSDLKYFSHLLVGADERMHADFAGKPFLKPLTSSGMWRAYEVRN